MTSEQVQPENPLGRQMEEAQVFQPVWQTDFRLCYEATLKLTSSM